MKKAELILRNANILTMDAQNTIASAVAIGDGKILAVGGESDVAAFRGDSANERDMNGGTVIPAFLDPHGHFPESGFCALHRVDLAGPPLGGCVCLDDVFDRLRDKVKNTPAGEFVFGVFFDQTRMREERFPTREELDAVSRDHPIWVMHMSFHAGAGNGAALQFAGVNRDSPQPQGGRIDKDAATGELTGLLEEPAAMGPIVGALFGARGERFREGLRCATEEYFAHGATTAHNAWANESLLSEFDKAQADGDLQIRLMTLPDASLEPALSEGKIKVNAGGNFRLGPRKLFSDGSIQIYTAYLSRPYHSPFCGDAEHKGYPVYKREELRGHVARLHDAGHQIHIHANGDAAADDVLFAIERAQQNNPRDDHRHTLIHGQTLREDQLDKIRELGVTISFFSFHVYVWGDQHRDIFLGPERAARISPACSAARRGIPFTLHNDTPVTPMRPFPLMWSAVCRRTASGKTLGEEQRITPLQALRAHTIDAAWQVFLEDEIGSVEPGKRADFAVLDNNPITAPPDSLRDMRVLETMRDGKTVFTAD